VTGEGERLAVLEARVGAIEAAAGRRKDRSWMLTLAVLSGLALPAILLLAGVLIHRAAG
jgi:hypothetical protein